MYVIMQCWNNLRKEKGHNSLTGSSAPDLFGATMRRAGVAITVTSITDVLALIVGASTV